MAKGGITLDINTKYHGEGINKLNNGIQTAGTKVSKVSSAIGRISGQFDGITGSVGKMAGGVGKVAGAFANLAAAGGPIALVVMMVQAGVKVIQKAFDWLNEGNEKVKQIEANLQQGVNTALKQANAEIEKMNQKFASIEANAKRTADVMNTFGDEEVAQLDIQLDHIKTFMTGEEAIQETLKTQIAKETQLLLNAADKVVQAQNKIDNKQKEINEAQAKVDKYKQAVRDNANSMTFYGESGLDDKVAEYYNKFKASKAQLGKAEEALKKLQDQQRDNLVEKEKAEKKQQTQQKRFDNNVAKAQKQAADDTKKLTDTNNKETDKAQAAIEKAMKNEVTVRKSGTKKVGAALSDETNERVSQLQDEQRRNKEEQDEVKNTFQNKIAAIRQALDDAAQKIKDWNAKFNGPNNPGNPNNQNPINQGNLNQIKVPGKQNKEERVAEFRQKMKDQENQRRLDSIMPYIFNKDGTIRKSVNKNYIQQYNYYVSQGADPGSGNQSLREKYEDELRKYNEKEKQKTLDKEQRAGKAFKHSNKGVYSNIQTQETINYYQTTNYATQGSVYREEKRKLQEAEQQAIEERNTQLDSLNQTAQRIEEDIKNATI